MRDYIFNFRQDVALEMKEKYKLSLEDLILIRRIADFTLSEKSIEIVIESKTYHWVNYETIQQDFPLLYKDVKALKNRIHNMSKKGLLESKSHIVRGSEIAESEFTTVGVFSVLRLSKEAKQLFNNNTPTPLAKNKSTPILKKGDSQLKNGLTKNTKKGIPRKEKSSSIEEAKSATASDETFFKNLKELLSEGNMKNINPNTLKNIKEHSNESIDDVKKAISLMKLKNKPMTPQVLVAILRDKDYLIVQSVDPKTVTKADKLAHMLEITFQDEINDLCNQIAKSFGYEEYNNLSKSDENIVNIELERILCNRYNKLHRGN
ncbi:MULTISPECIES: hypothetical protein [Psychrilyobacter]|uniref:Uncharacterized protein n=1 Tax=Psychrilyobacter piezotolerans TaxID=2293438 RepID=A0ABX9KJB5_9FUSO|nr:MULTISPECIES: hypothetical protein [Psychrilyobacter]MCS5420746.1 hypothetical protein [Psychrilyobacter sp. S5]NDI77462.1 hypothetical protein [Psychrilyobacter piezotolerans]RDE63762.1 hypothetical protein DV867_05135 [Psychrilyobacter sp. S5]REI42106.1 hypothetical protein DYH56_05135 [Psychrilyobacter piezotolerans]